MDALNGPDVLGSKRWHSLAFLPRNRIIPLLDLSHSTPNHPPTSTTTQGKEKVRAAAGIRGNVVPDFQAQEHVAKTRAGTETEMY
jgi:hypothetical protein